MNFSQVSIRPLGLVVDLFLLAALNEGKYKCNGNLLIQTTVNSQ